jgi:hypothetical protein
MARVSTQNITQASGSIQSAADRVEFRLMPTFVALPTNPNFSVYFLVNGMPTGYQCFYDSGAGGNVSSTFLQPLSIENPRGGYTLFQYNLICNQVGQITIDNFFNYYQIMMTEIFY